MANAFIWYYPDPDEPSAIEIDIGRKLNDRKGPVPWVQQSVSTTYTGLQTVVHYGGRSSIRLQVIGRLGADTEGRSLRRKLYGLINHLQRGGSCIVAEDKDYAFAAFNASGLGVGRHLTTFSYRVNLFEYLRAAVDITGREIVVSSDFGKFLSEMKVVTSHDYTNKLINMGGVDFNYTDAEWIMVRESGSWPAMMLPEDQRNGDFLPHEHEISFVMDLPLVEDTAALDAQSRHVISWPGVEVSSTIPGGLPGTNLGSLGQGSGWVVAGTINPKSHLK